MGILGIAVKVSLDFVFVVCAVVLMYSPVFVYMSSLNVGLTSISYNLGFATVLGTSQNTCEEMLSESMCEPLENFIKAGVIFLVLLFISLASLILSLCTILASFLKLNIRFLQLRLYHILYPVLYIFAFFLYIQISNIYSLPTYGLKQETIMRSDIGLYLMYSLSVLSSLSLVSYCISRPFCICDLEQPLMS